MMTVLFCAIITVLVQGALAYITGPSTQYEGSMPTQLGQSYLQFDGATSFSYQPCLVQSMTEFTIVFWLRIDEGQEAPAMLFDTYEDFSCSYSPEGQFSCGGLTLSHQLETDIWYIFIFQSSQQSTKLWLASYDLQPIAVTETNSFMAPFSQGVWPKQVNVGMSLFGSIRNLQWFRKYLSLAELRVAPFTYLHPYSDLVLMVTLQSLDARDVEENACGAKPISQLGAPQVAFDESAAKFCFTQDYPTPKEDLLPYNLEIFPQLQLMPYILTSTYDLYSTTMSRFFTLRMWFQRIPIQGRENRDQVLFEHDGVMKVFLTGKGYVSMSAAGGVPETYESAAVPYNQWIYLEAIVNVKQFGITVINQDGSTLMTSHQNGWQQHRQTLRPKYYVWVAQDFSGVIYALRYTTESSHASNPPSRGVNLLPVELTDQNVLLSFSFSQEMRYENFNFKNLARKQQSGELLPQQSITGTLNIDYKQTIWHDPGEPFSGGSISEPPQFDGVTCRDESPKNLQITLSPSIAVTSFVVSEDLEDEFTIEFWFRPTRRVQNRLVQLIQITRDAIPIISITKESAQLFCYPQLPQRDTGSRLLYSDFSHTDYSWQHVACSYSLRNQQIKGTLLKNQVQHQYFAILQNAPLQVFQQGNYELSIGNNNLYFSQTYVGLQVKEIRLWNQALTTWQIESTRFKQLRVQPNLMFYLKLQSEYHTELVQNQPVEYSQVLWADNQGENALLVCPLYTYHNEILPQQSQGQSTCFRDQFRQALEVKISSDTGGTYTLIPFLKTQSNLFYFGNQTNSNFEWTFVGSDVTSKSDQNVVQDLDLTKQKLSERSKDTVLIFNADEVSIRGSYTLKLEMNGEPMMLNQEKEFSFKTDYCSLFLDADEQVPWVVRDLNEDRSASDIQLRYEVRECSDIIASYSFQSVSFEVLNQPAVTGILAEDQNNSFAIPANQQGDLPLNDYFYVVATAEWTPIDKSEQSQALVLTLVYQLRFVSKIQISLTANPSAVARGQSLELDSSQSSILNLQSTQIDKVSFDREWVCPLKLQPYCESSGSKLVISYNAFTKANLQYWTTYDISIVAGPNFVQGDGSLTTVATTKVLWVNLAPGDGVIQGPAKVDVGQSSVYTVDFNEIIEDEVEIKWRITPSLEGSNYLQPLNQRQVNFASETLQPDTLYYLKASLIFKSELSEVISTANFKIQTLPRPKPALFRVTPSQGMALVTKFQINAAGWASNRTSDFQLFIQPHNTNTWQALTERQGPRQSRYMLIELPPCQAIALRVYYAGTTSYTQVTQKVDITYNSVKSEQALRAKPYDSLNSVLSIESVMSSDIKRLILDAQVAALQSNSTAEQSLRLQLERLERVTSMPRLYDRKHGTSIQQYVRQLVNSDNFDVNLRPLRDDEQMMLILKIQSNLLEGCEWLEISRQFSSWNTDEDIVYVTQSVRQLLVSFEESYSFLLAESDEFNVTMPAFNIYIGKYSSMTQDFTDVEGDLGSKLAYVYPLTKSCQQSVRQTLTLIAFRANPFLGAHPSNQTVVSNTTLYVSYRDVYGYPLNSQCVKQVLSTVFFYKFTPYFVEQVTTCGFFTEQQAKFMNTTCETTFNKSNDRFTCFCAYQNQPVWYSVLEDYFIRPLPPPPEFATFKDWATFSTLAYTCCFSLIGLMYTYGQDLIDFKHLRDIKLKRDSELMKQRDLPLDLVSLAQKRQVQLMPYADQFTTTRYWLLLLLQTHPLLQLRYQLDPQLQKLNKFSIYMCRLWVSMLSTFLMLGKAGSTLSPVSISIIAVALITNILLLSSWPNAFYDKLKHKYRLRVSPNQSKVVTDTKQIKLVDEQVYECDTNLPIRLLFILNSMPLLGQAEQNAEMMRFASGKAIDLCEKLIEMADKDTQFKEGGEVEIKKADVSVESEPEGEDSPGVSRQQPEVSQSEYESEEEGEESYYESSEYITEKTDPPDIKGLEVVRTQSESYSQKKKQQLLIVSKGKVPQKSADDDEDIIDTEEDRAEIHQREPKMGVLRVGSQHSTSLDLQQSSQGSGRLLMINQKVPSNAFKKTQSATKQNTAPQLMNEPNELVQSLPNISVNDILVEDDASKHQSVPKSNKLDETQSGDHNNSVSSLDSQVFDKERKEFYEADFNIESSAWLYGIIVLVILGFLAPAIYVFVAQKVFTEEVNYIWVSVFFGGQVLSVLFVNPLVCYIIAVYVPKVRSKKKQEKQELYFLCKWLRESLIIYEDYQFAVQFQNTRVN